MLFRSEGGLQVCSTRVGPGQETTQGQEIWRARSVKSVGPMVRVEVQSGSTAEPTVCSGGVAEATDVTREQSKGKLDRCGQLISAGGKDTTVENGEAQRGSAKAGGVKPAESAGGTEPSARRGSKRAVSDEAVELTVKAGAPVRVFESDGARREGSVGSDESTTEIQQPLATGAGQDIPRKTSKRNKKVSSTMRDRTEAESTPLSQQIGRAHV